MRFEYAFALVIGFGTLAAAGLRGVTVRTVAQQSQPLADYLGLMLSLRLLLACLVWPLLIICAYYLGNAHALVGLVAIASITLPVNALGTTLRDVLQGLERFDIEAATSVVVRLVTLVGALLVIKLDYGVVAIVAVYSVGAFFGLLVPLLAMRRAGYSLGFGWSTRGALRELKYAVPFGANALVVLLMWEINPVLIEALWSKRRILEVYLNVAQFGDDVYGAEAAARRYFRKPGAQLNPHEAALMAAVLPNPVRLSIVRPSAYVRERQRWILGQMRQLGGTGFLERIAW